MRENYKRNRPVNVPQGRICLHTLILCKGSGLACQIWPRNFTATSFGKNHWRAILLSWTDCEQGLAILDSPSIMHHLLDDFARDIRLYVMHQSQDLDATYFLPGLNCAASS